MSHDLADRAGREKTNVLTIGNGCDNTQTLSSFSERVVSIIQSSSTCICEHTVLKRRQSVGSSTSKCIPSLVSCSKLILICCKHGFAAVSLRRINAASRVGNVRKMCASESDLSPGAERVYQAICRWSGAQCGLGQNSYGSRG